MRTLEFSVPRPLFNAAFRRGDGNAFRWDVSADAKRFLIASAAEEAAVSPIIVVVNWPPGVKK